MTQEEFEKTVRARWPDAEVRPGLILATVDRGVHRLTIEWAKISEWGLFTHEHHAFADTLERAVLALEVEIVKEVQDWVADANDLLAITSPGSTVELMVRRPGDAQKEGRECVADLKAACTPRPPRPEYFGAPVDADGKPTGKWDAWMVLHSCYPSPHHWVLWRRVRIVDTVIFVGAGADYPADMRDILECIPVRREGPPAMDVGWDVVGR